MTPTQNSILNFLVGIYPEGRTGSQISDQIPGLEDEHYRVNILDALKTGGYLTTHNALWRATPKAIQTVNDQPLPESPDAVVSSENAGAPPDTGSRPTAVKHDPMEEQKKLVEQLDARQRLAIALLQKQGALSPGQLKLAIAEYCAVGDAFNAYMTVLCEVRLIEVEGVTTNKLYRNKTKVDVAIPSADELKNFQHMAKKKKAAAKKKAVKKKAPAQKKPKPPTLVKAVKTVKPPTLELTSWLCPEEVERVMWRIQAQPIEQWEDALELLRRFQEFYSDDINAVLAEIERFIDQTHQGNAVREI